MQQRMQGGDIGEIVGVMEYDSEFVFIDFDAKIQEVCEKVYSLSYSITPTISPISPPRISLLKLRSLKLHSFSMVDLYELNQELLHSSAYSHHRYL